MEKEPRKRTNKFQNLFSKAVLISFAVITLANIILFANGITIFLLNENQLLYLFSSMAQVIGGIFGLTLTAYVFFVDKFAESTNEDDVLYDAARSILKRHFHILILLAITTGATILFCIFGIIDLHNWTFLYPFIINESVLLFAIGVIAVLTFGAMLLDPQKLDKEIEKMKKNAEKYYQTTENSASGDFRVFLRTYNKLEKVLVDFAGLYMKDEALQATYISNTSSRKPQIIQALKILSSRQIIPFSLQNELNELRMYRNALVHGVDFEVSQDVCTRISQIYNTLQQAFDILQKFGKGSAEYEKAIKLVYDLTR